MEFKLGNKVKIKEKKRPKYNEIGTIISLYKGIAGDDCAIVQFPNKDTYGYLLADLSTLQLDYKEKWF